MGWEDKSFRGLANIVLRGNHNTPETVLDGGVVIGSKAIGMFFMANGIHSLKAQDNHTGVSADSTKLDQENNFLETKDP